MNGIEIVFGGIDERVFKLPMSHQSLCTRGLGAGSL